MDKDKTTSTNLLSAGVTLDDFWMLSKKPYLTKDGVYKKPEHGQHDALGPQHLKLHPTEEDEEKRQPPRLVILKTEIDKFIDTFYPHSELQKSETRALVDLFFEHAKKPKGYMTKTQFKRFIFGTLDMYDAFLCERMFIIFDKNKDELIDYQEWTHGMHTILVGSIHEHMKYCFLAYDIRGKGQLEPEDVRFWIKRSYYNLNPMTDSQKAEFYEDIYKLIMSRIGQQKDDYITFKKYRTAVCENPALMQLIGAVLPDPEGDTPKDCKPSHYDNLLYWGCHIHSDSMCTFYEITIVWKVNDVLFPRFFRSQHLMLFPRGDVPSDRGIKYDPSRLMKRYPQPEVCYPPNFVKGPDGKPVPRGKFPYAKDDYLQAPAGKDAKETKPKEKEKGETAAKAPEKADGGKATPKDDKDKKK